MSWAEMKSGINSTLGTENFKALNEITEEKANDIVYDIVEALKAFNTLAEVVLVPKGVEELGAEDVPEVEVMGDTPKVYLPSSVHTIKMNAFMDSELRGIYLPQSVTSIQPGAFLSAIYLNNVILPEKIKVINMGTFNGCSSLNYVLLPKNLERIESKAFMNCTALTKIKIPKSVTYIAEDAFAGCTALKDIYVGFAEGAVSGAPWGSTNATIHYNS